MALGPGKYDDLCTLLRERAKASTALIIVIGGEQGEGFSLQTDDPRVLLALPEMLEDIARQMRADRGGEAFNA
jgi:hypothetical protein